MTRINTVIRSDVQTLESYHVASSEGMLKLDAMESPFVFPEIIKEQWLKVLSSTSINRYPASHSAELDQQIKCHYNLSQDTRLLFGNGSDELIQIIIQSVAGPDTVIMAPTPSFVMYDVVSRWNQCRFVGVDLDEHFNLNIEAMLSAIDQHQPKVIFLAQPNNPTGNLWSEKDMEQIVNAAPGLVVIDEAYLAYSQRDYLNWHLKYKHVVILRTLSKVGLAGLRFGMLIGHADWLVQFDKLRMPYNINSLTQASVSFALKHYSEFQLQSDYLISQREHLMAELTKLGLEVFPSQANFILVRTPYKGIDVVNIMRANGVLIKNLCGNHNYLNRCIRVTVSTQNENLQMLAALQLTLAQINPG